VNDPILREAATLAVLEQMLQTKRWGHGHVVHIEKSWTNHL